MTIRHKLKCSVQQNSALQVQLETNSQKEHMVLGMTAVKKVQLETSYKVSAN